MSLTAALKVTVIMKGKCIVITYISVITLALLKLSLLPTIVIAVSNNLFLGDCLCSTQDFVKIVSQVKVLFPIFTIFFIFIKLSMSFCNLLRENISRYLLKI